jgi:hypothetical protein
MTWSDISESTQIFWTTMSTEAQAIVVIVGIILANRVINKFVG